MIAIFRVSNLYGSRDYDCLSQAKRNSKENETISFSYDYEKFSTVKRKYATHSWAKKCADKFCISQPPVCLLLSVITRFLRFYASLCVLVNKIHFYK